MKMTARSLFDTYFNIGFTPCEAFLQCVAQGIFAEEELTELKEALSNSIFRI